jgi:putative flippase GtrA
MRKPAMTLISRFDSARARLAKTGLARAWRDRTLSFKATAFAVIGLVNSAIDYAFFLLARTVLQHSLAALTLFGVAAEACRCGTPDTILLIAANIVSWSVAVSGSYVLNSSITFAAESGRKLSACAYLAFVISGMAGLIANTAALVFAAQVLSLPVWLAKACAILASFVVNFSLSHFVVFRARADDGA